MAVEIRRAFLKFDARTPPLIDVDEPIAIAEGLTLLVAASGSGKTTLLRLMAGWYESGGRYPERFALESDYDPLGDAEFIGNHQTLLPWYSIRRNIALRGGIDAEAERSWSSLALPDAAFDLYPYELSLGMYKRAELVAALCSRFRLLLLDEFFSSLDPEARRLSFSLLGSVDLSGRAVLITTHNPENFPDVHRLLSFACDEKGTIRALEVRA
jgi:NitT/TauT family transport system ATP-binding protein